MKPKHFDLFCGDSLFEVTLSDLFVAMKKAPQIHLADSHESCLMNAASYFSNQGRKTNDFGGSRIVQLATEQVQHWNYKFTLPK